MYKNLNYWKFNCVNVDKSYTVFYKSSQAVHFSYDVNATKSQNYCSSLLNIPATRTRLRAKNLQYDRSQARSTSATATANSLEHQNFESDEKSTLVKETTNRKPEDNIYNSKRFGDQCIRASFFILTTLYDIATIPIYTVINQPWTKIKLNNSQKSLLLPGEPCTLQSKISKSPLHQELEIYNIKTFPQLFSRAIDKHASKECLGTRSILKESDFKIDSSSSKSIKKYELGEYKWKSYKEVDEIVNQITCGLTQVLNLKPKDKIGIFAETREEWFMLAMAALKKNLTFVTIYPTLTDDGVIHALSETDISTLITSEEQLARVAKVLGNLPKINNIVCFESQHHLKNAKEIPKFPHVSLHWYKDLLLTGSTKVPENEAPTEDDLAIIMYTSGSTGIPKGVMLSHKNLISGMKGNMDSGHESNVFAKADFGPRGYVAYLPLAHVLEFTSEAMMLIQGVRIGYSSANTLVDNSIGLDGNTRGDCFALKPTIFPCVPLVLERIAKGIHDKISHQSRFIQILFEYFYNYKLRWLSWGFETPLVNRMIFGKARDTFGGNLNVIACGGAPLSKKTQEFIRTVLSTPIGIGYGMTETTSASTITLSYDRQVGRVGCPLTCNKLRLMDWEEGGYRITDKPNPRGELLIGGNNVALGYFKKADDGTFFTDSDGVRWIKTGDIAEIQSDNVIVIIDRKNDLVKLSNGEFISLGKIESTLKSISIVENICIYADSTSNYVVALVVPERKKLKKITKSLGKTCNFDNFEAICDDKQIEATILHDIQKEGKDMKLSPVEIPQQIRLCSKPWTPESGLVTASLKLKRANIYKKFHNKLKEMQNLS